MPDPSRETVGRVGRNTVYLYAAEILGRLLGAVFHVLLVRHLGVKLCGEFSFALTVVALVGVFSERDLMTRVVVSRPASTSTAWKLAPTARRRE